MNKQMYQKKKKKKESFILSAEVMLNSAGSC